METISKQDKSKSNKEFEKLLSEDLGNRRFKELKKISNKITLPIVKKSLKTRNFRDISRKNSPLLKSSDAVVVDTGKVKNISDMIAKMSETVEKKLLLKYGRSSKAK